MIFLVDFAWPWFCCYFLGVKEMLDFNLIQQQNVVMYLFFAHLIWYYQGYLAQALSFEYQLPVVAIDASSHHASVTVARAERIKKYYAAKWCYLHQVQFQFYTFGLVPAAINCCLLFFAVWRSNFSKYLGPSPVMFFLVTHWQLSRWAHVRTTMVNI